MPTVLVPLAEGFEELEAVTIIDVLRRADIDVVTASLTNMNKVTSTRGVPIIADCLLNDVIDDSIDMMVLPGGQPGANHLNADTRIHQLITRLAKLDCYLAAICAAPKVFADNGVLDKHMATAYPESLSAEDYPEIELVDQPIVIDGKFITSNGPSSAIKFALTLVEILTNSAARDMVEAHLLLK